MTDRELLQMNKAWEDEKKKHPNTAYNSWCRGYEAALAQPEPWVKTYSGGKPNYTEPCERCGEVNPADIHTCTPKQREWVGLTNEEIEEIYTNAMSDFDFIFDTQAKLKEKNSTTMRNIQTSDKND